MYLKTLGAEVTVVRNDAFDVQADGALDGYDGVLISPGPGAPSDSGVREDVIRLCANWLAECGQQSAVERSIGLQPKIVR